MRTHPRKPRAYLDARLNWDPQDSLGAFLLRKLKPQRARLASGRNWSQGGATAAATDAAQGNQKEKTGFFLLSFNEPLVPLLADPGVWNIRAKEAVGSPKSTSTGSFLSATREKLGCGSVVDVCPPQRGNPNGLAEELTFAQKKKKKRKLQRRKN